MFEITALISSILSTLIGITWIAKPDVLLKKWAVRQASSGYIVEHRLGALLITVGVILFLSSGSGPSAARTAISCGVIFGCATLFVQNLQSLRSGSIGKGILPGMLLQAMAIAAFSLSEFVF
ncbi:hypothetical protein [Xanthomonas sp. 3793]|uniref:hypothetical protein n=1 Tax=Xanthomonas sp. 3793 TaxID=3035312 RepID=UPI002169D946|nr:hypothetical protein [Xanthomonas sp. 3793]